MSSLAKAADDYDACPEYGKIQDLISSARDGLRNANAQLTMLLEQEAAGMPDAPTSADRLSHSTDHTLSSLCRDEISEQQSLLTCKTEKKSEESAHPEMLEFDATQLREQLQELLESTLAGTVWKTQGTLDTVSIVERLGRMIPVLPDLGIRDCPDDENLFRIESTAVNLTSTLQMSISG